MKKEKNEMVSLCMGKMVVTQFWFKFFFLTISRAFFMDSYFKLEKCSSFTIILETLNL